MHPITQIQIDSYTALALGIISAVVTVVNAVITAYSGIRSKVHTAQITSLNDRMNAVQAPATQATVTSAATSTPLYVQPTSIDVKTGM